MDIEEIRRRFTPAIREIIELCHVNEAFVDKDMFRVYIATIWGNAVLEPAKSGIEESELSLLHDFLNEEIVKVLGKGEDVTGCYEFIISQDGDDSLARLHVTPRHKEFLHYLARLILSA